MPVVRYLIGVLSCWRGTMSRGKAMTWKSLRVLITVAGLTVFGATAIAADTADQSSRVAGKTYDWAVAKGGQCREQWSFGEDGVMTIVSGEERVTKSFTLRAMPGQTMVELMATRTTTNGKPDCQGTKNAKTGQTSLIYLEFLNGSGFFTCGALDTMTCYGVATPKP
jgi:hypothetical protein